MTRTARLFIGTAAVAVCGGVAGWSAYAALTWLRYGRRRCHLAPAGLIDRYLPTCEVGECHEIGVAAPVATTYAAAREVDLNESAAVRAIFRSRELLMGGERHREMPAACLLRRWHWGGACSRRSRGGKSWLAP